MFSLPRLPFHETDLAISASRGPWGCLQGSGGGDSRGSCLSEALRKPLRAEGSPLTGVPLKAPRCWHVCNQSSNCSQLEPWPRLPSLVSLTAETPGTRDPWPICLASALQSCSSGRRSGNPGSLSGPGMGRSQGLLFHAVGGSDTVGGRSSSSLLASPSYWFANPLRRGLMYPVAWRHGALQPVCPPVEVGLQRC